jgi:peptidoglycan/xylan/chitin deacetylase (PgdA/CDA1 family)
MLLAAQLAAGAAARSIAITIDDAPRPDTRYFDGATRTAKLIETLAAASVGQVMFFCNSARMHAGGIDRIRAYARAGHLLANHSHSHLDLHQVGVVPLVKDIEMAVQALGGLPNYRRWFRYPYLHEGRTLEERDGMRSELKRLEHRSAYVTVDTFDWHMDRMFQVAVQEGKKIDFDRLRAAYVDLLTDSIEFYDGVAQRQLGRSPRHVLLLHENDLAALYLGDLVAKLRSAGWRIITPEEAFEDPIATVEPDTLQLGQGRIMAIAATKGYQGPSGRWEDEKELERQFARRAVWK